MLRSMIVKDDEEYITPWVYFQLKLTCFVELESTPTFTLCNSNLCVT